MALTDLTLSMWTSGLACVPIAARRPTLPLFVFLPGMDGTGDLFHVQAPRLEAAFDIRCLAIPPLDQSSWRDLATQAIALIRQELDPYPNRTVYLCGESFGACLALQIALLAPTLCHRLILVNPASSFYHKGWLHWASSLTSWVPAPLYQLSSVGFLPWLAALPRIAPRDRQALLSAMQSVPQTTSAWRLRLLQTFAMPLPVLRSLHRPTLLIAGALDRLLPSVEEIQRLAQALPVAETVILPESGHACLLETDVDLFAIMRACGFLDAIAPPCPL